MVSGCDCDRTVFGRGIMTVEASATAREDGMLLPAAAQGVLFRDLYSGEGRKDS